jgi:hypothetical protein
MMPEFEKWLARVLLLNSGLALAVSLGLLGEARPGMPRRASCRSCCSAPRCSASWPPCCRSSAGRPAWPAACCTTRSSCSAISRSDGGWQFSVKAGVSIGLVMRFHSGVLVLNMVALALLAATAAVLAWRVRRVEAAAGPRH